MNCPVNGIRTMSPDVIILDELMTQADIEALNYVFGSGVKIIATTHSKDLHDLQSKPLFREIFKLGIFERFVMLSSRKGAGTLEGVWDNHNACLFCP